MKKYLLLVEDEKLWDEFKGEIDKDINSEIISLIREKVREKKGGKKWSSIKEGRWLFLL